MFAGSPIATYHPSTSKEGHSPLVHCFFDGATSTWTYLVVDPSSREAFVIDPVLDFDPASGAIRTDSVKRLTAFIHKQGYKVSRIIDSHVHADHASGAHALKAVLPGSSPTPIYIGENVARVQETFASVYGIPQEEMDGSFDGYLRDGDVFRLGGIEVRSMHLPGHTPDSMGILVGDSLFAGDSIFQPDVGTARVDFPGGSADDLYSSIQKILQLDGNVRVFSGHDYPKDREHGCMSTIAQQIESNLHVGKSHTREAFLEMRRTRDKSLGTPRLLHAALQINLRGGRLPRPDAQGHQYLKTPLKGDLLWNGSS